MPNIRERRRIVECLNDCGISAAAVEIVVQCFLATPLAKHFQPPMEGLRFYFPAPTTDPSWQGAIVTLQAVSANIERDRWIVDPAVLNSDELEKLRPGAVVVVPRVEAATFRQALEDLVGEHDPKVLAEMRRELAGLPEDSEDKAPILAAIDLLIATAPGRGG